MDTQNKTASRSNMVQRGPNVPKHQTKRPSVRKIYHSRGRLNVSTSTHIKEPNHKGRHVLIPFAMPGLISQHITTRHTFRMKCTRFSSNRKAHASRQDGRNSDRAQARFLSRGRWDGKNEMRRIKWYYKPAVVMTNASRLWDRRIKIQKAGRLKAK